MIFNQDLVKSRKASSIDNIKNPIPGLIIYDSSENILKYFNGLLWINII